jgi:hypothetical protein
LGWCAAGTVAAFMTGKLPMLGIGSGAIELPIGKSLQCLTTVAPYD